MTTYVNHFHREQGVRAKSDKPGRMRYVSSALVASTFSLIASANIADAQTSPVNTTVILHNGVIVTQDAEDRNVSAVAVLGDRIVAAGSEDEILSLRAAGTCVVDLQGKIVIPGLSDSHVHTGYEDPEDLVDLVPARNLNDIVSAIQARASSIEPGELILTNGDWHEGQLEERRLPTVAELDKAAPDNPVVVVRGGHSYILNTAALKKFNITKETAVPEGGAIPKTPEGELTGELIDTAKRLVKLDPPPAKSLDERLEALQREQERYASLGLTSYRVPGVSVDEMKDYMELYRRGLMKARASVLIRWDRVTPAAEYRKVLEAWLSIGIETGPPIGSQKGPLPLVASGQRA